MTYIEALDPNSPRNMAMDAAVDQWDDMMPGWQEREAYGVTLIGESDMAAPGTLTDRAVYAVSDADFDAMCEALWQDPAERPA